MARFKLEIDLGNDAMRTWRHLAGAMAELAGRFDERADYLGDEVGAEVTGPDDDIGTVHDINGNAVGKWTVL